MKLTFHSLLLFICLITLAHCKRGGGMMGGGGDGGPAGEGGPCGKCNNKNNPRDQDNQRERNDQAQAPAPGAPGTETLDLGGTLPIGGGLDSFASSGGAPIDPSVPDPVVVAPPTTTPPDNSDQPRARELSNINNEKRKALLERKGTDLTGAAAKEKDIQTLYDALAVLLSDKRCGFAGVETEQTFQSRSAGNTPSEFIKIDPSSTGIGGGDITFYSDNKNVNPVTLSWNVENFTKMSLKDWLYGHPNGSSNGHIGFYRQLVVKKLCGLTNAEHPDPIWVRPTSPH